MAQPGTVPIAGGVGGTSARRAKSRRDKESAAFILVHLDNEDLKDELDQPQFRHNGPEIFDHIMAVGTQEAVQRRSEAFCADDVLVEVQVADLVGDEKAAKHQPASEQVGHTHRERRAFWAL